MDILFASNNHGKYDELVDDFKNEGINLIFPKEYLNLPETSEMLSENAYTKAKAAAKQTGMISLGDDSGVFIEALDYFPGVHSRRWFADADDDEARNKKILEMLSEYPDSNDRTAYLISRFSVVDPDGNELAKDVVKNEYFISDKESGINGFGYDRILIPSDTMWDNMFNDNLNYEFSGNYDFSMTTEYSGDALFSGIDLNIEYPVIADLTQEQKNAVTYRGRIAKRISKKLKSE